MYKPYPTMKQSGVPWIGEIPVGWEVGRIKYSDRIIMGQSPSSDDYQYNSGLPFLQGNAEFGSLYPKPLLYCNSAAKIAEKGDILLSVRAPVGAVNICNTKCGIGRGLTAVRSVKTQSKLIYYYLLCLNSEFNSKATGSTYVAITADDVKNTFIPLPPLPEQRAIAAFLDRETSRIDALIDRKERLIALLKEKRQALITRAVTKGLDPNAPMKDSGVPWIGEIPEGWEVSRLKFMCKVNPSKSEVNAFPNDSNVSFIPMESVSENGDLRLDEVRSLSAVYNGYTYCADNDVIVAKITPCFENGKGALCGSLTNGVAFASTEFHVLRPGIRIDAKIIYYITKSFPFRSIGESMMIGAAGQKRVPEAFIKDYPTPLPPLLEQRAIAAFLDRETSRIDAIIDKVTYQITKLRELRQTLISHAVTGKIDVRGEVAVSEEAPA